MTLLAAVFADTIDLEGVARGEVVVSASDLLLELADFLRKEFHRAAAFGADHVVMAAAVVLMLVAGNAVVEGDLTGESALGEKLQRAINGGVADAGVFFLHEAVEFVGGEMVASFEERAQDGVALRGLLQPHAFQMTMQDILGFPHHLAGERRLIVNAFLQHAGTASQNTTPAS